MFGVVTGLLSPTSRGRVRLRSADPDDPPRIDAAFLRTAEDVRRMVEATRHARRLARTPPLADLVRGDELAPGPAVADDDDDRLAASIRARVGSYHHPVGTCAMGAVVDARGAVHGLDGRVGGRRVRDAEPAGREHQRDRHGHRRPHRVLAARRLRSPVAFVQDRVPPALRSVPP